jgi:hypothetical protein
MLARLTPTPANETFISTRTGRLRDDEPARSKQDGRLPAASKSQQVCPGPIRQSRRTARAIASGRLDRIVLQEIQRTLQIKEDGKIIRLPAICAVIRGKVREGLKGNGRARRDLLSLTRSLENPPFPQPTGTKNLQQPNIVDHRSFAPIDVCRRIALIFQDARREDDKRVEQGIPPEEMPPRARAFLERYLRPKSDETAKRLESGPSPLSE